MRFALRAALAEPIKSMNKADGEPFVASKVLTKKRKAVSLEASPCSPRTEGAPSSDPALESIQTTSDDELDDIATLLRKYAMRTRSL